jgi:hypothetical protein
MTDLVPMVRDSYTSSILYGTCYDQVNTCPSVASRLSIVFNVQTKGTLPIEIVTIISDAVPRNTAHDNSDMMKSRTTLRKMNIATSSDRLAQVLSVRAARAVLQDVRKRLAAGSFHRMFLHPTSCTQPSESSV